MIQYNGEVKEESDNASSQSPSIASKLDHVLAAARDELIKAHTNQPIISQALSAHNADKVLGDGDGDSSSFESLRYGEIKESCGYAGSEGATTST